MLEATWLINDLRYPRCSSLNSELFVLDTPLPLDGCVQRPMHKDVGYCQEVTTIMADALDEIYTYTAQCLECFFHVNWTKYADLVGMNVSSDVYSMRIYCCQHKKQMRETTAEPRAKTFTCSHCIRVCGSRIRLYIQSRRCSNRDWHTMGAQPIVSRDRRRPTTTTTIFITSISCFVSCLLYSWYIGWHNNCGDFSYCNRHPPTNSKLKLSIYNLLDATSL